MEDAHQRWRDARRWVSPADGRAGPVAVADAMAWLPYRQRAVLALQACGGLDDELAARALGIDPEAVRRAGAAARASVAERALVDGYAVDDSVRSAFPAPEEGPDLEDLRRYLAGMWTSPFLSFWSPGSSQC